RHTPSASAAVGRPPRQRRRHQLVALLTRTRRAYGSTASMCPRRRQARYVLVSAVCSRPSALAQSRPAGTRSVAVRPSAPRRTRGTPRRSRPLLGARPAPPVVGSHTTRDDREKVVRRTY